MNKENLREIIFEISKLNPIETVQSLKIKGYDEIDLTIEIDNNDHIKINFIFSSYETKKFFEIFEIEELKNKYKLINILKREFNDIHNIRLRSRIFRSFYYVKIERDIFNI